MTSAEIKKSFDNPATSYWLKNAISQADKRDILDAMLDADLLLCYLKTKAKEYGIEYLDCSLNERVR